MGVYGNINTSFCTSLRENDYTEDEEEDKTQSNLHAPSPDVSFLLWASETHMHTNIEFGGLGCSSGECLPSMLETLSSIPSSS